MSDSYAERLKSLEDQIESRIHWGADMNDIRNFLSRNAVPPADAEEMIRRATKSNNKEVRSRAILGVIFWGLGATLFLGPLILMYFNGFIMVRLAVLMLVVGVPCLFMCLKSIYTLLTCQGSDPMR